MTTTQFYWFENYNVQLNIENHCKVCLIKFTLRFAATVKIHSIVYCFSYWGNLVPNRPHILNVHFWKFDFQSIYTDNEYKHLLVNMHYLEEMCLVIRLQHQQHFLSLTVDCLVGGSCRKWCLNTNDMLYLIIWATWPLTFYVMLSVFLFFLSVCLPLPPPGCLHWQPQYDSWTIYFIVLISLLLWITHVCCGKCHRSVLYEITMQFTECSAWARLSSRCRAHVVSAALFDACIEKH